MHGELSPRYAITSSLSAYSSVRHCSLWTERRACAADDVTGSSTELDIDDAVQDEVDGEVDQEQTVDDDRRRLIGEVLPVWRLRSSLQHVLAEEIQQSRRSGPSSFRISNDASNRYSLIKNPTENLP